ncbi:MAG: hypothetical protein IK142_04875 [Clostridiales bacterium]|nr:hypothetical protein [Clostridiales bacterium]
MTWLIKVIMFVCIVPTVILMYMLGFSKNPGRKKLILGVRDNPKFHEGEGQKKFDAIVDSARNGGLIITVAVVIMSIIMLFLPVTGNTLLAWVLLVFALFLVAVPYGKGNTELKNLKRQLGITKSGVTYTDITSTNVVHALKLPWVILPNALALIGTIAAVLIDLGVTGVTAAAEKYALTTMSLSFLFVSVILVPLAVMMDNTRNMVISRDSNINANYNRAKKKTWADIFVAMSWVNTLCLIAYDIVLVFTDSEAGVYVGIVAYVVVLMAIVIIGVINQNQIERRYERDTELELQDDDDNWILGMFYYNKNDTRLNVEKRFGYGGTVNLAHPAGKVIGVVSLLVLVGSVILIIYLNATGQLDTSAGV